MSRADLLAARRRRAAAERSRERGRGIAVAAVAAVAAFDVGPGSARLYRCHGCGRVDQWRDGWQWLGRLEGPVERIVCPDCPRAVRAR